MQTKRWNIGERDTDDALAIEQASDLLKNGETVAFPTETVYGLGADATNEAAVEKIFQAKGRPGDNPLIAHVASKSDLQKLVTGLTPVAERLIDAFTPGPMTFVLPSNGTCAHHVTSGLSTIGVRIPSHPTASKLLKACGIPLAAPSANLSGKPSPTTADHVWEDLNGKIAGLLDDGPTGIGVESTVVDCTEETPVILRPGGISRELIEAEIGYALQDTFDVDEAEQPRAPGMKYKHYAPSIPLWLVDGDAHSIQKVINEQMKKGVRVGAMVSSEMLPRIDADEKVSLGDSLPKIAAHVYSTLRAFDIDQVDLIVCQTFPEKGIGKAIMNRLQKAATEYVKNDSDTM